MEAVVLFSIRIGSVLLVAPPLNSQALTPTIRVILTLGLATVFALAVPTAKGSFGALSFAGAALCEALVGMAIGLGLAVASAAIVMGFRIIDTQIGYGLGHVLDISTRHPQSILSSIQSQITSVLFFVFDGHLALVQALMLSVERVPLGAPFDVERVLPHLLTMVGQMSSLGFAVAAPLVVLLLLAEFGLGLVARSLPQINALMIAMPLKVLVGLSALAAWGLPAADAMHRVYRAVFRAWEGLWW